MAVAAVAIAAALYLALAYLGYCVSGSGSATGALVVVPDDRVVGKVSKLIGFTGLSNPHTYRR
jgi:hypothetical protein